MSQVHSTTSLDLNTFGERVLRILRTHKSKLVFAGDVCLYVGQCSFSQSDIDTMGDGMIHELIRLTSKHLRFDRWQSAKRTCAVSIGCLIDLVCEPCAADLSDEMTALIHRARVLLGTECLNQLSAGYSVRAIAKGMGISHTILNRRLADLRPV